MTTPLRTSIVVLAAFLALSAPAAAAPPAPAPQEDDFNFLQLGVLTEQVAVQLYSDALEQDGWTRAQRSTLRALRTSDTRQVRRLISAMGEEAPADGDFEIVVPPNALRKKGSVLGLARKLERLTASVYTSGAQQGNDPGTRLLLARLLGQDVQHLSALALMRGASPITALPGPIGPEKAGEFLDRFLTVPSAPPIPE